MYRYSRWGWQLKRRHSERKLLLGFPFCYSTPTSPENEKPASPGPPPIRVSITEMAGRGVFATRRIGSGDLIHTAKPLVSHPSLSSIHSVCYFCLRKLKPVTSSEDCNVRFCSHECEEQSKVFVAVERKADWSAYDDYCRTRGLKYPLLVKRLACMVVSGVASADCLDILQPASLSSEMISEMGEGFSLLQSAFMKAKARDECMAFLTEQWYINVLARFRINAFRIELAGGSYEDLHSLAAASVETEAAVGNAVYMLPSFYNHDCEPLLNSLEHQPEDSIRSFRTNSVAASLLALKKPAEFLTLNSLLEVDPCNEKQNEMTIIFAEPDPSLMDPNAHIIWIDNVNARLKALREIEAGEELRICYIDASMDHDARQTILFQGFGFRCSCLRCSFGD